MLKMTVLDYLINSDENNVTVERLKRDENGAIKTRKNSKGEVIQAVRLIGYFRDLEMALKAIQKDYLYAGGTEIKTITDYKSTLTEITNEFHKKLKL